MSSDTNFALALKVKPQHEENSFRVCEHYPAHFDQTDSLNAIDDSERKNMAL